MFLLLACVKVPFVVAPPPPVPEVLTAPAEPQIHVEPTALELAQGAEAVGANRLSLQRKSVGVAAVSDAGAVSGLHDRLLVALLDEGFTNVVDLEPARRVLAAHKKSDVQLYGFMDDVMRVAQVSRTQYIVAGELTRVETVELTLPVRFWYEEGELTSWDASVDSYLANRQRVLGELASLEQGYGQEYDAAYDEYDGTIKPWQRAADMVNPPQEELAYEAWRKELEASRRAMPETFRTGEELAGRAEGMEEVRTVEVYEADLALQVRDSSTGRVLSIVTVSAQGRSGEQLTDNLADLAATALGDR